MKLDFRIFTSGYVPMYMYMYMLFPTNFLLHEPVTCSLPYKALFIEI